MSDPEWTGSLSYAGDIMASNRNNNMNSSSSFNIPGLVSSFGTAPNNMATTAASTRTLPQHGLETVVGSANGSPLKESSKNKGAIATTEKDQPTHETIEDLETTRTRRCWTHITWMLTWYLPTPFLKWCGRMRRPDVRMAWREKVAICVIIFFIWCVLLFIIIGLGLILCPKEYVWTMDDVASHDSPDDAYVALRGRVYDISDYINQKHGTSSYPASRDLMLMYIGQDINATFPISIRSACSALVPQKTDPKNSMYLTPADPTALQVFPFTHKVGTLPSSKELSSQSFYTKYVLPTMNHFKKGDIVWDYDWVNSMHKDQGKYWRVINKEVFNLEDYFATIDYPGNTDSKWRFLSNHIENIFDDKGAGGTDITDKWSQIPWSANERTANYNCMKNLFYVGKVDDRHGVRCLFTNYMLLAFACVLMALVLVKFLAALQFGTKNRPTTSSKFVICQVPCYTEDDESLEKTINSLASLSYEDNHKLMFIVCDGNIIGSGNDKPTPRIVLDILGVDPEYDPPGRDYLAIAEGSRRHNIAKVYSGLYDFEGHVVPFMVAVKVGTPDEANRSGNRGKRDSQILLMSFLNKVHFDLPMTPLELEIFHQMRHIIGIHPHDFEYILQVDADTEVMPDSLSRLIAACSSDQRIAGICGETMLGNENKSWTTMMQVYEYFISHHMAKAFESLFGSVTCLPGCFCMYRLRSGDGKPLLIAKPVLEAYSELHVDTLHKKNLLSLGEDRYLTTLMMKHFPQFKLKFIQDAKCKTIAPEKWAVLMSQRRRWINSTIHNLAELMFLPDLCGFCCFSMRFVVFLDLFGTLTMPTTLFYFAYLIYIAVTGLADVGIISLILIGAIYGVQAIIFILRREWQHIGWMLIYLLAYPLWSCILPIYSFWHMDDFSWGNTRVVVGDGKRKLIVSDDKAFDPESIPQRRWGEYEADLASAGVLNAPPPNMNPTASSSREEERMTMYSRQSQVMMSNQMRVGSMYGYPVSAIGFSAGGPPNPHYAAMGGSTRSATPAAMVGITGANGVADQQRYSMAATAMAMQQPMDTIRSHVVSMYANNVTDYATVRSPSPAVTSSAGQLALTMAAAPLATQSMSYEHAAVGGLDISGVASMPEMAIHQQQQQQQQQQQRPMSFAPAPSYPGIGTLSDLGTFASSPSDSQLVEAIRKILGAADLNSLTKKKVRQQLCQEFNKDLTTRKDFISDTVDRILSGNM